MAGFCFWQEARLIIRHMRSTLVTLAQRLATGGFLLPSEGPFELVFPRISLRIQLAPSGELPPSAFRDDVSQVS